MQEREVRLHAILLDGTLNPYPQVKVESEQYMPSGGDLSNPGDKALVKSLEDKMIEAYGNALVEAKCKAAGGETVVDLSAKMIRPVHVNALFAAVECYKVAVLKLDTNQLGAAGAVKLATALKTNATVTSLSCAARRFEPAHECWPFCQRPLTLLTTSHTPLLAVCEATASVPREQPLSRGASRATQRCKCSSKPPPTRTSLSVRLCVSAR